MSSAAPLAGRARACHRQSSCVGLRSTGPRCGYLSQRTRRGGSPSGNSGKTRRARHGALGD
eukprot:4252480-Lingulodinium_polyedra.AAC.1